MLNKKGISNIVATVLIVLLALAAVAIIWSFLQPMLEGTSGEAALATKCLQTEVRPTTCVIDTTAHTAAVTIQYNKGEDITKIIAYLEDDANAIKTGETTTIPSILETTSITGIVTTTLNETTTSAKATVEVTDDKGNTKVCDVGAAEVQCTTG